MKKFLILIIPFVLIVVSCRKEQPSLRDGLKDCGCAKEASAKFAMEEMATPIDWPYTRKSTDTDTIYANGNVWFHAEEENADYTWYIGAEILHGREVFRYFTNSEIGQNLPMTLVVRKKPNHICLPNDDGYDSITRYLTVVDEVEFEQFFTDTNSRFEGIFRLKDISASDSIDVTIDLARSTPFGPCLISIVNFDGQNSQCYFPDDGINYRQIWLDNNSCYSKSNYMKLNLNGVFELKLKANEETSCKSHHLFGRKI